MEGILKCDSNIRRYGCRGKSLEVTAGGEKATLVSKAGGKE
ncbi:hypothetical protein [Bacillus xiapuensis]|nr:hypothetical protein [Bacillus xiapuensis]